jgi:hypothetical protein
MWMIHSSESLYQTTSDTKKMNCPFKDDKLLQDSSPNARLSCNNDFPTLNDLRRHFYQVHSPIELMSHILARMVSED